MINCRAHAKDIQRTRQPYLTRLNKIRLGMNEYIPTMPQQLFDEIISGFTIEMASAYPEVNLAYNALSRLLNQPRDRLVLSQGADMAIRMSLEAFCNPGDTIATIAPTFAMYGINAALLNCNFREVLCEPDGSICADKLLSLLAPSVKVVILANPGGVTGYVISLSLLDSFAATAAQNNTLLIIDETYGDFAPIDASPLIEKYENVVIVRSFSKNIGMAGLRIGYVLASEYLANAIEKFKPMVEINALAARAIIVLCSHPEYLDNSIANIVTARCEFIDTLRSLGFFCLETRGNFALIDFEQKRHRILSALENNEIEYKILSSPLQRFVRITVATSPTMQFVLDVIRNAIK